jgi:hypothetical protein
VGKNQSSLKVKINNCINVGYIYVFPLFISIRKISENKGCYLPIVIGFAKSGLRYSREALIGIRVENLGIKYRKSTRRGVTPSSGKYFTIYQVQSAAAPFTHIRGIVLSPSD